MSVRTAVRRIGMIAWIVGVATAATLALSTPAQAATTSFFRISNVQSGLALTADSTTPFATVRQQPVDRFNLRQQWIPMTNSGTAALTYKLRNTNLCLDLPRDVIRSQQLAGEVLVVRTCDGTNTQKWLDVNTTSGGVIQMQNKLSNMRINIDDNQPFAPGAVANQNNVFQPSQKWFRVFVTSA